MKTDTFFQKAAAAVSAAVLCISTIASFPSDNSAFTADAAADTVIHNDTFWKDTSGKNIYSQGGGIFKFGDTYYWYGVHYKGAETYAADPSKKNNDYTFVSVSCYSSKDLVNWKFENDVLTPKSKGWNWAYWVGRMGVTYCPKSKKYVLVTQYNDSILFAQCDSPTGNFEVKNVQDQITNVLKAGTGDQTVFVDDDGQAYIVCSNKGGRGHQYISKLRESDFLYAEPAKEVAKGSGREGNCLFKYKGKYYFCASDLHGWNSSHSYYMVADNINGPYSSWKVMDGTDEDFSYVTQTGFFVTVKGSKQETVLYCGDRWSDFAGNGIGYNQWVPLTVNGDNVKFNSLSEWSFNAQTGEWSVGAGNNYCLNPTFEADRVSQTTLAGWKASGTGNSNKKGGNTGNWCAQQYDANAYKATLGAVNLNNAVNYVVMAKPYSADTVYTTATTAETTTSAIAIETTTASAETTTVSTEATTVTAALTTTDTATTATTIADRVPLYGDANCDGKVTVSDAVAILQYIGNRDKYSLTPEGADNADVSNRGYGITANDALAIQKLDAGIIDTLPES